MGEFFAENQEVLVAISLLIGGLIVKITPTKVDDAWFQKIKSFFEKSKKK